MARASARRGAGSRSIGSSRLAISYHVGKRDQENANIFLSDLRSRLIVMPTLTTSDGYAVYPQAVETAFGSSANFAQCAKQYSRGPVRSPDHKYEPPRMGEDSFIKKKAVLGTPNLVL